MIENVSDTALWVAAYRARESKRPDALFQDPLAERLIGERGRKIAAGMKTSPYTSWSVVVRTRVIDAFILELVAQGVDTVINLGAGLDTRPYRLALPSSLRWIEVDYPHMMQLKDEKLAGETPHCRLERVKLDLSDETARAAFFTNTNAEVKKALVLTEGVIPYLSAEQVVSLAQALHRHPNFRYWIAEYYSPNVLRHLHSAARKKQMRNAPFRFAPPGDWFEFFAQQGWTMKETRYLAEVSYELGREIPAPWLLKLYRWLAPVSYRNAHRKQLGYMLLEPR